MMGERVYRTEQPIPTPGSHKKEDKEKVCEFCGTPLDVDGICRQYEHNRVTRTDDKRGKGQ